MKFEIKDKDIIKFLDFLRIKSPRFRKVIAIIEAFLLRLEKNHSFLLAAGIAFNIILYVIPLLLVALYIVNLSIGADKITSFLTEVFEKIIPENPMLNDVLTETIKEVYFIFRNSSFLGWIGIITLLWLSSALLSSLRTGLNTVFKIATPKTYFFYKIQDIFLIIAIALLILIMSFVTPLISFIQSYIVQFSPDFLEPIFNTVYVLAFSLFNSFLLFYLLFRFVPDQKMHRLIRFISIISCILFVEASRYFFSWYMSGISAYGKFYGTYAIVASMALWVYYLTFIILFSAELGKFIYDAIYGERLEGYIRNVKIPSKSEKAPM
ncbi:YihY/virulence factor BrkB family protein [Bacteroidota bacterium]